MRALRGWLATRAQARRERAKGLRIGMLSVCDATRFGHWNTVHQFARLRDVTLGDFSYVANGARIVNARIGKFVSIGPNSRIGVGVHPAGFVSTHPAFYSRLQSEDRSLAHHDFIESVTIEIGHDAWIGEGAIVMDGVVIGDGAIVGAGAVVTRDVAPYAIVAGVPAKLLRYRFSEEDIAWLRASRWWDRDLEWLRVHAHLFKDPAALRQALQSEHGA
jgi:acetyltransferase-like isoleucine patch superfamily enzyme